MKVSFLLPVVLGVCLPGLSARSPARAADAANRAEILIGGVHCQECVAELRQAVRAFKGVQLDPDDIQVGRKPRYFTDPIMLRIVERSALIGQVAKAVADQEIPHAEDAPSGVFVVLYTPDPITEVGVMELRAALRDVNGLEVMPGQLGGFPKEGFYWVRLEDAGGAALGDIIVAARKANDRISLTRP